MEHPFIAALGDIEKLLEPIVSARRTESVDYAKLRDACFVAEAGLENAANRCRSEVESQGPPVGWFFSDCVLLEQVLNDAFHHADYLADCRPDRRAAGTEDAELAEMLVYIESTLQKLRGSVAQFNPTA